MLRGLNSEMELLNGQSGSVKVVAVWAPSPLTRPTRNAQERRGAPVDVR